MTGWRSHRDDAMEVDIRFALGEDERRAVFGHRFRILVEELGQFRGAADHWARLLEDGIDAASRQTAAYVHGELVGSMRWTWGGDEPLPPELIERYQLAPFLERVGAHEIIVGERTAISKAYRGSEILFRLYSHFLRFVNANRIQLVFGNCEPQLLSLYLGLGFRTYAPQNVSAAEAGYLVPLVLAAEDLPYLHRIDSPLVGVLQDFAEEAQVPEDLTALLAAGAVASERLLSRDDYRRQLETAFAQIDRDRPKLFDDLDEDSVRRLLASSNVIACRAGDRVLKKGDAAQDMYIVLSGALEVRDGERLVSILCAGDLLGEIAFLLHSRRTADVIAVGDDTRVLSLGEPAIRELIDTDPAVAATMMLNISKMLCQKMLWRPD